MNTKEFKKYRTKIIIMNLSFFVVMMALVLLALYNKNINNLLFSENLLSMDTQLFLNMILERYYFGNSFLFVYIWGFCVIPLLSINFKYFQERNKYYAAENIVIKENKKLKRVLFYFFLLTTITNILFFVFSIEETFIGKYGFTLPENTVLYSFLTLLPNIALLLATIIL